MIMVLFFSRCRIPMLSLTLMLGCGQECVRCTSWSIATSWSTHTVCSEGWPALLGGQKLSLRGVTTESNGRWEEKFIIDDGFKLTALLHRSVCCLVSLLCLSVYQFISCVLFPFRRLSLCISQATWVDLLLWWHLISPGWTGKCGLLPSGTIRRLHGSPAWCTDCCRARKMVRSAAADFLAVNTNTTLSTFSPIQLWIQRGRKRWCTCLWVIVSNHAAYMATTKWVAWS